MKLLFMFLFVTVVLGKEDCYLFDGSSYIEYDLSKRPISSTKDTIELKFQSSDASGLLLYASAKGLSDDHLMIELVSGKVRVRYQLGAKDTLKEDIVGDGLGDDIYSTVNIARTKRKLVVSAHGGQSEKRVLSIPLEDDRLDLNGKILVGGYLNPPKDFPSRRINFKGCFYKAMFNTINLLKDGSKSSKIRVTDNPKLPTRAINFGRESKITIRIQELDTADTDKHIKRFNGSFEFRTVVYKGTIFKASAVSLVFQKSDLMLKSGTDSLAVPFPNSGFANDGRWFKVEYIVTNTLLQLTLNGKQHKIQPKGRPQYGGSVTFGYFDEHVFIGCIRNLVVNDKPIEYSALIYPYRTNKLAEYKNIKEGCKASDPCLPNPCFHEAECLHDAKKYFCDCKKSYKEPLCQFSEHETSCSAIKKYQPQLVSLKDKKFIDPDDSGPLPAVQVFCDFTQRPETGQTEVETLRATKIQIEDTGRYSDSFSFKKKINYSVPIESVRAIVQRSQTCEQNVKYECKFAKLFNLQGGASSRWVSPDGYLHYYWGGARRESYKCACAYTAAGCGQIGDDSFCNCDSNFADKEIMSDEGLLNVTRDLPVYEVQFGGLRSNSHAVYTVEKIVCYGVDALGVVTFRAADGWLRLPPWDSPLGGDISFYIKTDRSKGDLIDHRNKEENYMFQVRIYNAKTIQVVYSFGTSLRVKFLAEMADGLGSLSDNQWHRIHVIRTLSEAWVEIDRKSTKILQNGKELLRVKLTGDSRSRLDIDLPMFVGGFWRYPTYKDGFIGCMKGFTINGVFHDLENAVDHLAHEPEALVVKGCGNACSVNRCPYGECVEKYTAYECDCSDVPFYGTYCSKEIGARIENSAIHSSEVNVTTGQSKSEKMVLAFSTDRICSGTLFEMLSEDESQYYKLSLTSRTELTFEMKLVKTLDAVKIAITATHVDFCDGARHIVFIERTSKKFVKYKVDRRPMVEKEYKSSAEGDFDRPYFFYVGSNKDVSQKNQFRGCISGVKFHLALPTGIKTVEPIREGVLSNDTGLGIVRDTCGPTINTPSPLETRDVPAPTTPTDYPSTENLRDVGIYEAEDSNWAVLIVVALLMMLLLLALVVLTIWYVMQHKSDYQILEKEDGTVVGTATVRGGNSLASVPAGTSRVHVAAAPSHASQASQGNLSRAKSKSNDVFV